MQDAIVLQNLTKRYRNQRGIEKITLHVEAGEVFGFLGPNGAGKTTAMKIMTGLMRPDSGDVFIGGYSVTGQFEKAMRGVGCIVESVAMFPYLTAYENMRLCARFCPDADSRRIDDCLEEVGMSQFKNEKVKSFSLGMRQRMGIAMALVTDPAVLIVDEPLNGLDVEGMVQIRRLFGRLAREKGTTVFISSHLIHDVELMCNRVGVLCGGRLLDVRKTGDILKDYSSLENYYLSEVDVSVKSEGGVLQ